jgi:putative adhesin
MTAPSLPTFVLAALMAAPVAAQPRPPLVVRVSPERAAWFERFEDSRRGPETVETVTKTFKTGAGGSLDVSNLSGDVIVNGVAGDQITVTATKRARGNDAKAALADINISARQTAARVEVRTEFGRHDSQAEVDYDIEVPFDTGVIVRTISGDVKVTEVRGTVLMDSTSGDVQAWSTPRLAHLATVSGDVRMHDIGSPEGFTGGTVSGDFVAEDLKARSLDVTTVSGDVTLTNVVCERAQIKTVNGSVGYRGPLAHGGRYEMNSHSGDIILALVGDGGFELTAKTFSGDVRADWPMTMAPTGRDSGIPGMPGNHEVRGTYGDGSALVIVKTFSGDVVVERAGAQKQKGGKKDKNEK